MENKMEKNRIQKLAGIREANAFKGALGFKLDRFIVYQNAIGTEKSKISNTGEWCQTDDVAKLEAIANKMYDILNQLDRVPPDGFGLKSIQRDALAVLAKAKTL